MRRTGLATFALMGAAFLFGITFVVVKSAVATFPPIAFVAWRFAVGSVALCLLALPRRARLWRDALVAGVLLFAGYALQTAGLTVTDASSSALITGLYVVLTPLLAAALARRVPNPWVVVGSVLAFIGLALVGFRDRLVLGTGDLLTLGCAVAFAGHIVALARFAPRHPIVPFTAAQLAVTAALAFAVSLPLEGGRLPATSQLPALAVTGLGVSAGAYLLQVWAQTHVGPDRTAVVLALEPAFGVAAGAALLGERLTFGGWSGALLIMGAIYLVLTKTRGVEVVEAEAVTAAH